MRLNLRRKPQTPAITSPDPRRDPFGPIPRITGELPSEAIIVSQGRCPRWSDDHDEPYEEEVVFPISVYSTEDGIPLKILRINSTEEYQNACHTLLEAEGDPFHLMVWHLNGPSNWNAEGVNDEGMHYYMMLMRIRTRPDPHGFTHHLDFDFIRPISTIKPTPEILGWWEQFNQYFPDEEKDFRR